jgi:hypothetical protein
MSNATQSVRTVKHRDCEHLDCDDHEHEPEHGAAAVEAPRSVSPSKLGLHAASHDPFADDQRALRVSGDVTSPCPPF